MTIEEAIIESLRDLPPGKQQEVLDFNLLPAAHGVHDLL